MRRFRHGVRGVLTALLVLGAVAPAGLLATRTTQAAPAPALSSAATANVAPCDQAGLRSAFAAGGTLTFAQSCALSLTAPLTTTAGMSVTLDGGGYRVTLDGGNATQLVVVPNGATVTLSRLTLAQGYADNQRGSAGGLAGAFGGAIKNAGNLTIVQSTLVGNTAQGQPGDAGMAAGGGAAGIGGAIYSAGPGSAVTIVNSTLVSNTASGGAGGDHGAYSGCPSVAGAGGGYNAGSAGGCFYAGGNGGFGGGGGGSNDTSGGPPAGNGGFGGGGGGTAYNGGGTGGVGGGQGGAWGGGGGAGLGGAIFADGSTVHILNSTITGNQARGGRGGYGTYFGGPVPGGAPYDGYAGQGIGAGVYISGTLSMTNSIVAANTATVNVGADLQAAGTVGSHNLMGGNPTLGPLQDNGGPTQTIAPLAGSAAIGAGDTTTCQAAPVNDVDQRGQPRPLLGCDSGAYDTRTGPVTPTPTATQKQAPTVTSTPSSSPTAAPTWTMTPTATQTATATPTATLTPTWTATPPPTKTPTTTPTSTPAARNNGKHNGSPTSTPTATRTPVPPTASNTPVPPTATSTPTVDPTATRTPDPPTATSTSVPPTPTSTPTVDPLRSDASVAYQLDAAHTGNLAGDALTPPLYQLWAVNLGGAVSYPLVVGKLVYVTVANTGTYGTQLYALDKATGATVWGPVALGGTYNWSGLTYDNSRIFALNYDGLLRAFDATTGTLAWSTQLPGQYSFTSPPTALNGIVYTGGAGSGGTVYAVRETNGALLWTAAVMNGDESSPAVTGTGVYVSYACQQDYAFAPGSGALLWHHSTYCEGGGGKTPVLAGSTLYSRDNVTGNLRLDAATGTEQGAFSSTTAPAFDGTRVYVRSGKTLNAVDPRTQATLWSFTGDGSLSSAPLVVNGCVYEASGSGHLYALDAATGAVVDTATLPAGVAAPDEQNAQSLTGLGAGGGALVVPASSWLVSYT